MEWKEYMQLWGPAVPMFAVFIFYLHRLVFKTVPRGFSNLRRSIESLESTNEAHATESALILQRIESKVEGRKKRPRSTKKVTPRNSAK